MNIKQELNIEQETNRVEKGYNAYNQGLVEKLNDRVYLVKGKYEVEDLTTRQDINPVMTCSCPDHQYRGVDCSHIISVQFYMMGYGA
jgi:hypothetical protein